LKTPAPLRTLAAMKFILTTHNVTLTKAIEEHVLMRIERVEHIDRWLIDARVTLEKDHEAHSPDRSYKCAIRLGVRGRDLFAEAKEADLYAAIDFATRKLEQQLRRRHSKKKERRHSEAARVKERGRRNAA
jgi:putative sigma-54 modulation protein